MNYEEIVKATIKAGLIEALDKDSKNLIEKLVHEVLNKKESYSGVTFIDRAIHELMTAAVRGAIREEIEKRKTEMQEVIRSKLSDKFFAKISERMAVGIAENLQIIFAVKEDDCNDDD